MAFSSGSSHGTSSSPESFRSFGYSTVNFSSFSGSSQETSSSSAIAISVMTSMGSSSSSVYDTSEFSLFTRIFIMSFSFVASSSGFSRESSAFSFN
jgi:hypothetical protein